MPATPVHGAAPPGVGHGDEGDLLLARVRVAVAARYDGLREIGRGGMAVVYAARDRKLNRDIALKVLPPDLAFRTDIRERFVREAQTAARLNHPSIVPIYAVDEADGLVYFVMSLVQGESLADRLVREPRPPLSFVRSVLAQVADALAYAHRSGVIHRDIKPDNILLEHGTGRAIVTDFGIARAVQSGARLTQTGIAVGTPAFMSPEQAVGQKDIDGRSDVYALGVVGYLMLSARLPFDAESSAGMLVQHVHGTPFPLANFRPDLPFSMTDAITRALARDVKQRWPDAASFAAALRAGEGEAQAERDEYRSRERVQPLSAERDAAPQVVVEVAVARPGALDRAFDRGFDERSPARMEEPPEPAADPKAKARAIRRMRFRILRSLLLIGVLFVINAFTGGFPWFIFPALGISLGLLARLSELGKYDVSVFDLLPGRAGAAATRSAPVAGETKLSRAQRAEAVLRDWKRRITPLGVSLGVAASGLFGLAATGGDDAPFLIPLIGGVVASLVTGALFVRDTIRLHDVGLSMRDAIGERWRDKVEQMDDRPRAMRVSSEIALLADAEVLQSMHGRVLREAVDDATTIRETWAALDPSDRELVADVSPTAAALLQRIAALTSSLARLEGAVDAHTISTLEKRIRDAEAIFGATGGATGASTTEQERRLTLLRRQHTSLTELLSRQDTLVRQLENASLVLRSLRFDVVKLRALGVGSAINDVTSATQEVAVISRDIDRALDVADELRKLK